MQQTIAAHRIRDRSRRNYCAHRQRSLRAESAELRRQLDDPQTADCAEILYRRLNEIHSEIEKLKNTKEQEHE